MELAVRELNEDDAEQARRLSREVFAAPSMSAVGPTLMTHPGRTWFGVFDRGNLVAQAIDREYESWFGGAAVPTSGVAYVGVSPAYRGRGLVRTVLDALMMSAVARGAVISTLFPTAPRIYRGLGYERICDLLTVRLPTEALVGISPPTSATTRKATVEDLPAIRRVYERWAREQNGPLTRRGPLFTASDSDVFGSSADITVAEDGDGVINGYASSHQGQESGAPNVLHVADLFATEVDGYRALLGGLARFSAVTPTTSIRSSGDDVVRLLLPTSDWQISSSTPYLLRLLDVEAALSLRTYPPGLDVDLPFAVDGGSGIDGRYALTVHEASGKCRSDDHGDSRHLTPQGLASLYGGAQSCANLRLTGHLRGGDPTDDSVWDALFGGRQAHIRDYF